MALPRRFLWSITETAVRWNCLPADIIDWCLSDQLEITTAVSWVLTEAGESSGLMMVPPETFVRMFRRDGTGPRSATVRWLRRRGQEQCWQRILEPADGLTLEAADLVLTSDAVDRFEEQHELGQRPRNHQGGASKWDWEGFYAALILRVHEHGLPDQQTDLVNDMLSWFEQRSETGEAPDVSTIRKKVAAIWRELRAA
jgi:hypothetical protein